MCAVYRIVLVVFTFNDICLYGKTTECNAEMQSSHVEIVQNVVNENFLTADEFIEIVNNWDALASSDFLQLCEQVILLEFVQFMKIRKFISAICHLMNFNRWDSTLFLESFLAILNLSLMWTIRLKNSIIFSMEPQEIVLSALRTQDMDYESFRDEIDIMLKIIRERAAGECEILLPAFFKVSDCNDVRKVEVCESTVVFNIEQRILQQESALPTIKQQDFFRGLLMRTSILQHKSLEHRSAI